LREIIKIGILVTLLKSQNMKNIPIYLKAICFYIGTYFLFRIS